jgi:PPIC-type PPIASE domain
MVGFEEASFLKIEGQTISLGQAFGHLQLFGRLQPFVQEYLRYYALLQEIQTREDLLVTAAEVSQAAIDFRLRAQLSDAISFDRWLSSQGIDYATFENQVIVGLKLEKLKDKATEVDISAYFADRQNDLDEIELYYIVVAEESLAQKIKEQVNTGKTFEQIARDYPLNAEQKVVVKRETLRRERIRVEIRSEVDTATSRQIVGAIPMGDRWCLFQVEQVIPSVLDDRLKNELREELFNRWLAAKVQELKIESANNSNNGNGNNSSESELVEMSAVA